MLIHSREDTNSSLKATKILISCTQNMVNIESESKVSYETRRLFHVKKKREKKQRDESSR